VDGGFEELPSCERVEPTGGLVEEQQFGSVAQGTEERDLACLALRERFDSDAHSELETFDEALRHVVVPGIEETPVELDDLANPEEGGEVLVFGDEADPSFDFDWLPMRIEPKDLDGASVLLEQPHRDVDEGGLAGAVAAKEADYLSGIDAKIDAVQNGDARMEGSMDV
jgi:hypothetical protein